MSGRIIALVVMLAVAGSCVAQADAPVPRPDVKVGDRWSYQRMDYDAGKVVTNYTMKVVFAARGVIQVVNSHQMKEGEFDNTYTAGWNAVSTEGRVFNPHNGHFRFPLRVGATYSTSFETGILKKKGTSRNDRQVRIVGWEDVVVPAGKFRALKIVAEGLYARQDANFSGTARNIIWYVPEVKRWVKMTGENRPIGRGGPGNHSGEELLDYEVR